MHLTMLNRFASVLLSGAFLASCGSGPMKGAFSRQLLEEVSQRVAANEVPQPRADGGGGETFAPGAETNEVLVFPVGSALLRSEDGVEYAYIFSQESITTSGGTVLPEVVQTWIFDTDDDLVAPNVVLIESIVSDDSIAVAGGQTDVTLRNDVTGVTQTNIQTDFYRLEAQYSGLAYWIAHSDAYFGSAEYVADDFRMGFYGLATPISGQPPGLAVYEGRAFGSYMRNIQSTGTAAEQDRFLVGGDVELLVDFDAGEVSGEASLVAYTTALVLDPDSDVVIELADGSIESGGFFKGSNVSVMADGAGTGVLSGLTEDLPPSGAAEEFTGMFTGPEADELAGRANLVGTGYALRFGFVAKKGEAEEIPEVVITKIKEDLQSGETEQPTAKPEQRLDEDTGTTVVFPTEEDEAIARSNGGETFVLVFEEEDEQNKTVVQTWTFSTSDPVQTVADNLSAIEGILGTSLDISGSRSEVERRDSSGEEQTLNADVYLFEGAYAGFGLWVEKPDEFFGSGSYSPGGTPVAARFYGLATPSADFQAGGTAVYEGTAAGAFVRDYISGTVAVADRFTIGGDIELEANFGSSTIGGSVDIQAYALDFAATSPVSRVSLGLVNGLLDRDKVSFAGSVEITAGGTGELSGLTEGLTPDQAGFSGIFSGPKADEAVGRAEFRTGMLALQFGFLAARENEAAGVTSSVLTAARTRVDDGTSIDQPPAGSESFGSGTANDLTFPAGDDDAVIRSKDGSEYAYVFKEGDSTQAWTFTVSDPGTAVAAKANALRALAGEGYTVTGGRDAAADGYIFERRYSGLGIWAEGEADAFFGSGSYSSADLDLSIYGLATPPAGIPESVALYVGRAFGVYLKSIQQDGSAAAPDRFVVSGTVEIEADFEQNALGGSVQLVAHRLTSAAEISGSGATIELAETSQTSGRFDGDASVQSAQGIFASLTGVSLASSSGYSGFLAGPAADELVGEALLLASDDSQRLEFGFIGEFFNVIPIDAETLEATEAMVLAGDEIAQPEAASEDFDALTAEPIVFPASEGAAIVRSRDGFEYAYIFREGTPATVRTWYFAASGRNAVSRTITSIRAGLHADLEAYGLRSEVSRLDASDVEETFDTDIYILEASHAGVGLWVEKPDEFFGAGAYGTAGTPVGAVFYGLTPATNPSAGTAAYAGSAIGGYMRNIQGDGTVAAADRFLISGDVELTADFSNALIGGSAALTASSLNLSAERGTAVIGFGAAISSGGASLAGDVWIAAAGNDALSALTAGLSPDVSSSFNGLLAGPDAGSVAGRAVFREADQALLFGFAASADGAIHSPANPIAASVLAGVRTQVDNGTAIAQPVAGSESFDSATANDLAFPAAGGAVIRSTDGSEYAHVFRVDSAVYAWRFAAGSPSAAANVVKIRNILDSTDIDASGSRSVVSRGGSIFSADAYVFEGSYAGFGLLAEEPERFFDSASDDYQARRVAVRHYGLAAPASAAAGAAVYAGKAAGGYMRNIKPDGTVEGGDRFLISGTVALTADFGNSTILGSADLIAHSLDISSAEQGKVRIILSGTPTTGNVDVAANVEGVLSGLTAGLSADEGSGVYASLLAGATAQELAGNAELVAGNQGLLFGFIAKQSSSSGAPASPIAASVLTSARTQVDNGSTIAQPVAGSESFDSATANDLTFPVAGGAVIRSKDGSEYAYVFKANSVSGTWRFNTSSTPVQANADSLDARLDSSAIDVSGSRSIVSRASEVFYADLYAVEASYSGFGLLIEDSDQFFSSASDGYAASGVSVVSYGFADSSAAGYAQYAGKAAGSYMRNIQSNGTVAAADRFVISGEIALTADLLNDTISGSADLIAHSLDISAARRGEIKIGISGSKTDGNVDILTTGTEMLGGLTANLGHDAGSGVYASQLAGGAGQEYSASAEFLSGTQSLVFGFTAAQSAAFVNIPSGPITASVLTDTNTKVDAGTNIAVPIAGNESFDPDTPTANDVVLQNTDGGNAVIRSKDGSEYAFVFKKQGSANLRTWRFASDSAQVASAATKINTILNFSALRTIGSDAQVKDGDDVFDANAFVFEQSYSGFALLIEEPDVFFDDSLAYSTAGTRAPSFGYGLRPIESLTSGLANYTGKAFGTYMSGITGNLAQGTNRYLVSGDVELAVDFRAGDILGSVRLNAYDLDLDPATGAAEIEISCTNCTMMLSELSRARQAVQSATGVLSGVSAANHQAYFAIFNSQGNQISGYASASGSTTDLRYGFAATDEDIVVISNAITNAELRSAIRTSGPRISRPKAGAEKLADLADSAFFPGNSREMVGRAQDKSEFYVSLWSSIREEAVFDGLRFSDRDVTGGCFFRSNLTKGESCSGQNTAGADEVFAFVLAVASENAGSWATCEVTNALTSKYSNGDQCELEDLALGINYSELNNRRNRSLDEWFFLPGSTEASGRAESIEARLQLSDDIDVFSGQTNIGSSSAVADGYFFEAEYAGIGLLISSGSNAFFGASTYSNPDVSVQPFFYGLEAPAIVNGTTATYEGEAAGFYMRNIAGTGTSRTVAANNRFIVTGAVSLDADFGDGTITGTADLVARNLEIAADNLDEVEIGFNNGVISDASFSGDVAIKTAGTTSFSLLTADLAADNISEFRGLFAGTGAQEIAGNAIFRHNNIHILKFGFFANSTTTNVPTWALDQNTLEDVKTMLDAEESIDQPAANDTVDFDSATSETLIFPAGDGAIARSPDGSEFALLPLNEELTTVVGFTVTPTGLLANHSDCDETSELNADTTTCQGVNSGNLLTFDLTYSNGSYTCSITHPGSSGLPPGSACTASQIGVNLTEVTQTSLTANIWRFSSSSVQAVKDNASNINTIINSSAIDVFGARSSVTKNDADLTVDAYILEAEYSGFGFWAEDPASLFDPADATYTADELSMHTYGMATPASDLPSTGTASYSGKAFGIYMRDTNTDSKGLRFFISSDFSATATFTSRAVDMTFGTISAYELDYNPTTAVGSAQLAASDVSITASTSDITGTIKVKANTTGTGVLSDLTNPSAVAAGTISGMLAGPDYDEMVGSASLTEAGDVLKMGFIGSKQ